jgi:hypothetical protein
MNPDEEELVYPPRGGSVIAVPHVHKDYQMIAKDLVIVRWCPSCGKTWMNTRYSTGGPFRGTWEEIRES